MTFPVHTYREALTTLADGTIKQVNPFSGTQVWTVPGRSNRPLSTVAQEPTALSTHDLTHACAFCEANPLATPPEKARIVRSGGGWADWEIVRDLLPHQLGEQLAEFRRVPNLFEIVSYNYWMKNYGFTMSENQRAHLDSYLADDQGREHVLSIARTRLAAEGRDPSASEEELLALAPGFFAGGHDVIIARRHYIDGAKDSTELASSGTLTPEEHYAFVALTIDAISQLYELNPFAPYVAVFQNWLKPAGASFDHLHKQAVAIDERGVEAELEIARLRHNPNMYNEWGVNYALDHDLVIAENDHAILITGIGHRYPTLSIYSKSASVKPWNLTADEVRDFSDLLHAAHAATGTDIASNEEWHHAPIDLDIPMPFRVHLKWRVSTLAGFEGGTKIYVNTLSPQNIRERTVNNLYRLRNEAKIATTIRISTECTPTRDILHYNETLS